MSSFRKDEARKDGRQEDGRIKEKKRKRKSRKFSKSKTSPRDACTKKLLIFKNKFELVRILIIEIPLFQHVSMWHSASRCWAYLH